jgi:hypothetical protein
MQVAALKEDYDKFYNNPDKQKQDRYQAWLKSIAKDNFCSKYGGRRNLRKSKNENR